MLGVYDVSLIGYNYFYRKTKKAFFVVLRHVVLPKLITTIIKDGQMVKFHTLFNHGLTVSLKKPNI